jgi:tetratricopeptide (TPR) repeat protein
VTLALLCPISFCTVLTDSPKRISADANRCRHECSPALGRDHPQTLTSRNNLAGAYVSAGRLGAAIPLYEQTLADSVRVPGQDHPDTLGSRNNLAYVYESAGRLGAAISLYEQTLADSVRVLGEDHPDTPDVAEQLAGAYRLSGRLRRRKINKR